MGLRQQIIFGQQDVGTYDLSLGTEKDFVEKDKDSVNVTPDIVLQVERELLFVKHEHLA